VRGCCGDWGWEGGEGDGEGGGFGEEALRGASWSMTRIDEQGCRI
jgi:hypothetical protein